jgi:hypothetical protein
VFDAGFAGLTFFVVMEAEDKVVGGIVESDEAQMRLKSEARAGVERCDLVEGKRGALGVVKSFDESPLDSRNIKSEAMAAAGEMRVGS